MDIRIFNKINNSDVSFLKCQLDLDEIPVIDDVDTSILSFIDVYGRPPVDDSEDTLDEKHAFDELDDPSFIDDIDDVADGGEPADEPAAPTAKPAAEPVSEPSAE